MARRHHSRVVGAMAVLAVVLTPATPAAADAPRPTNYRSTVVETEPPLPAGVHVQVVGGDAFLELTVAAGHTAMVPDYPTGAEEPVPYLRFGATGRVEQNRHAVATTANDRRFGATPTNTTADAAPAWEIVATNGRYAWHDHRIHWMSPRPPRAVDSSGQVDLGGPEGLWEVPVVIDGRPTIVRGSLVRKRAPTPIAPALVGLSVGAVVLALGRRGHRRAVAGVAAMSGIGALVASWATWAAAPIGSGVSPTALMVSAVAVLAALGAGWGPPRTRLGAWSAAAATLLGWGLTHTTVLTHAELPTTLPFWVDRVVTAAALGTGAAVAVMLVWVPVRSSPSV